MVYIPSGEAASDYRLNINQIYLKGGILVYIAGSSARRESNQGECKPNLSLGRVLVYIPGRSARKVRIKVECKPSVLGGFGLHSGGSARRDQNQVEYDRLSHKGAGFTFGANSARGSQNQLKCKPNLSWKGFWFILREQRPLGVRIKPNVNRLSWKGFWFILPAGSARRELNTGR